MSDIVKMDHSQFHEKGKEPKGAPKLIPGANRWWLQPDDKIPQAVMAHVAAIINADRGRIDGYNTFAKLYGTYTPTFWNGYQLSNSGRPTAPMRDRLSYNIVQSCIDTTVSKIAKEKPKPMFLTSAGDSKIQRRAKKLDAFMYGLYYENNMYTMAPKILRDSLIFGEGIIHPYAEAGRIKFERVLPYEILVDYLESHYGPESTLSLHRIKNIDRTELMELYPKKKALIASMDSTSQLIQAASRSVSDTVTVVESWRLPVGEQKGRHTLTTGNVLLGGEEYKHNFFPFPIMRFNPRVYGFYSQGMAEQLVPLQVEINRTLISIQRSLYLGGTHKIFVKAGSKVIKSHFDNAIGTILEYAGDTKPEYIVPQLVQPEIYSHLESMIQKGYQQPGVSQMNAAGLKTPGVNSGRAMRTEQNINSERFDTLFQSYQQFFVDSAKVCCAVGSEIYGSDKNDFKVKVPGRRFIQTIKWSEVNLDEDEFVLQIYPVSKLPSDPEGRLATIQEMAQAGWIDTATAKRLMDFPDLDAEENLSNAQLDYLHKILDEIIELGKFTAPDAFDNPQMAERLALEYYIQGKLNDLDEDKLEMLRLFVQKVRNMQAPAPQMVPQAPGAGQPPANPQATPQSDLVPNLNQAAA